MRLTGQALAAATGGRLVAGDPNRPLAGFSIDSRTLAPGDVFLAIRGERFDGHDFVEAAVAAGAGGLVVSAASALGRLHEPALLAVQVADTTRALQALAHHVRRASGAQVVAITGSTGKTTTKEIAAEFLAARYRVFRNRGNLNNHIGLPLSLLELRHEPQVAVVELGMNHAGEISALVAIAEPDVRVWTNVGDAHLGFFASVDALARAKAEILDGAAADTVLVANADDGRVMAHARKFAGRLVTFGFEAGDVRAMAVDDLGLDGLRARVRTPAGDAGIESPLVGRGHLANLLAATAIALQFDVPLSTIVDRAAGLQSAPHRGAVMRLRGGVSVLDESYNASPAALANALQILTRVPPTTRRVAFLGEMLELGEHAERLHAESGRLAASSRLSVLVAIGGIPARTLAEAAVAAGMDAASVRYVESSAEAATLVPALVRKGDVVLVKGSRGIATERVVERLSEEFG